MGMMLGDLEGDRGLKRVLKKGTCKLYNTGCSALKISVCIPYSQKTRLYEIDAILENSGGFFKFFNPTGTE
jgi:hypothetical protein